MRLPEDLETLLDEGRTIVDKCLKGQGSFIAFALAQQRDGEIIQVPASGESTDLSHAIGEVLAVLLPLAKAGKITSTVLCTPIPPGAAKEGWSAIMFDLEHQDGSRIYAILPYRKHDYLGWQYGSIEYTRGKTQIFSPQPVALSSWVEAADQPWPFDQPQNTAVITLKQITQRDAPILRVAHDTDDHGWQFLNPSIETVPSNASVVSLEQIVKRDPSVLDIADLPVGWFAWRKSVGEKWVREPSEGRASMFGKLFNKKTGGAPAKDSPERDFCLRAFAYLKIGIQPDSAPSEKSLRLDPAEDPVLRDMGHGLLAAYMVDMGEHFQYVQNRHLTAASLTPDALHQKAVHNLAGLAQSKVKVQPYGNIYTVLMGGNYEASLILFDGFWSESCAHLAPNGFVATFPARAILAFTDARNESGIDELRQVCERGVGKLDHPLTNTLFKYVSGRWEPLVSGAIASPTVSSEALALFAGYAFSQAIQIQTIPGKSDVTDPFVVHWRNRKSTVISYPAEIPKQAVALANEVREDRAQAPDGWSSGKEDFITLGDGTKREALTIEAWVPGLDEYLVLHHYYAKKPFVLVGSFMFKINPQFKRNAEETKIFLHHFKRGISSHPFGETCLKIVEQAVDHWPAVKPTPSSSPKGAQPSGTATHNLVEGDGWQITIPVKWTRTNEKTISFFNPEGTLAVTIFAVTYKDSRGPEELIENSHNTFLRSFEKIVGTDFRVLGHQKLISEGLHCWLVDLYDERRHDRKIYKHMAKPPMVLSIICNDYVCTRTEDSDEVFLPILASAKFVAN